MNKFIKSLSILIVISPLFAGCNSAGGLRGDLSFDIYASNDFHGAIENQDRSMGLGYFGTFMKRKGDEKNTLLIDQGDSWQGSIYSNYNRGALVNDVMCYAKFDSRTVGNHDFDWGIDALVENTNRSYNGYTIPVLAANVYNFDFIEKEMGDVQQSEIGQKHVTYKLENGLKVGIVGVIGTRQITSITSSYVQDIGFKDHIEVIKQEAEVLRKQERCNVVIASVHAGQEDCLDYDLNEYVDLVLCGHTHQLETKVENGLSFVQFGAYGRNIGHIKMSYNAENKKVSVKAIEHFDKNKVISMTGSIDPEIQSIINRYNSECQKEADVLLAADTTYFSQDEHAPNLMCKAIYDECVKENQDVILSYCNTGRAGLPYGSWTYADLYQTFPFDNTVYIANIRGSDILYEIRQWNNVYFNPDFDYKIERNKYYKVACLDYLLFHTNAKREYDYFSAFSGHVEGQLSNNYRVILKNWLIDNGYQNSDKALRATDYSSSLPSFNRSLLTTGY